LRPYGRAIADGYVIDDSDLPGQGYSPANPGAPGDTRLRGYDAVLADRYIVSDLNQIVDFRSPADNRTPKRSPIDRRVGADLDVVFDLHSSYLRNLDPSVAVPGVTEAVTADDYTGVQDDAISQAATFPDNRLRIEHAIFADMGPFAHEYPGIENATASNPRVGADKHIRIERHLFAEVRAIGDASKRAYLLIAGRRRVKYLQNLRERQVRIRSFQVSFAGDARRFLNDAGADNDGARGTTIQVPLISRIGNKRNLAGSGLVDRRKSPDNYAAVSNHLSLHMVGKLRKRFGRCGHYFFARLL
jgi:hypothetical protein